jgi:hypothetical protein
MYRDIVEATTIPQADLPMVVMAANPNEYNPRDTQGTARPKVR